MIYNIFKNWNFVRLLRLAMGIFLVVEAVKSGIWFLIAVGAVFVAMPLLNIGCCASGNCAVTRPSPSSEKNNVEIDYEEIK